MKRTAVVLSLILMLIAFGGPAWAAAGIGKDVIRVGTESTFPPFVFHDAGGHLAGFDIDLANAIVTKLGKKIEFVDMAFVALFPSLAAGRIDMIAAGLSITTERGKIVDFSKSYFTSMDAVVTRSEEAGLNWVADLRGRTVTVQARTIQDDYLSSIGNIIVRRYQRLDEALLAVLSGGADAAFLDGIVAKRFLEENALMGRGLKTALVDHLSSDEMAFAVRKIDSELLGAINHALDELRSEGYLKKLEEKWLPR